MRIDPGEDDERNRDRDDRARQNARKCGGASLHHRARHTTSDDVAGRKESFQTSDWASPVPRAVVLLSMTANRRKERKYPEDAAIIEPELGGVVDACEDLCHVTQPFAHLLLFTRVPLATTLPWA